MPKKIFFFILISALVFSGASCISFSGSKSGGTGPVGFFASTDRGDNWKSISLMPTTSGVKNLSDINVYGLVEDPLDTDGLYWLSRGTGIYYSYDSGNSWRFDNEPQLAGFVYSLAIHPANKCAIFATNGRQVFKTEDCSRSWVEMYREADPAMQVSSIAFNPFAPFEIFFIKDNGDLLRSEDSGKSWQLAYRFNGKAVKIAFDAREKDLAYVATKDSGLYRTKDGGKEWESLEPNLSKFTGSAEFRRMYINPKKAGHMYWISKHGILMSRNAGTDWETINLITPPGSVYIYSFAVNPTNEREIYYTATVGTRSTFYRSVDGGKNWVTRKLPSGQLPITLRVHPKNTNLLYLGFTVLPKQ